MTEALKELGWIRGEFQVYLWNFCAMRGDGRAERYHRRLVLRCGWGAWISLAPTVSGIPRLA
jgi:hypothetical protein